KIKKTSSFTKGVKEKLFTVKFPISKLAYPFSKINVGGIISNFQFKRQVPMPKYIVIKMHIHLHRSAIFPQPFTFFTLELIFIFETVADPTAARPFLGKGYSNIGMHPFEKPLTDLIG